jgi:DNA helicase-2/ATP-dependent DNA helicase PcrA
VRFPNFSDLDEDQLRIYAKAPTDGAILVVGPPGTGKTVMAFHRAQRLQGIGQDPSVIMFNKVLRKYSEARDGVAPDIPVMTMHQWVYRWWRKAKLGQPPKEADDNWSYDWNAMLLKAMSLPPDDARVAKLDWGHLIIDEGQDFPETMYFALGRLIEHLGSLGKAPRITVFADDNQRLAADKNSSVKNIARLLGIAGQGNRVLNLSKNYRNTKNIAEFAGYFQVGKSSGAAALPGRLGEIPEVGLFDVEAAMYDFISRRVALAPGRQVGVIVHGSIGDVKTAFNKLKARLKEPYVAQRYFSTGKQALDELLDFESPNTVTVLHERSAKGLEFDIVFYIGLERANLDGSGMLNERMSAYVMSSRARDELIVTLCGIAPGNHAPDGLTMLPRRDLEVCRYDGFGQNTDRVDEILKAAIWREPDADAPFWKGREPCLQK